MVQGEGHTNADKTIKKMGQVRQQIAQRHTFQPKVLLSREGQQLADELRQTLARIPEDDEEAVKWFRLAAEQGNAHAQNNLGEIYRDGTGVPQDDTEAMKWYRLAADQGLAQAQYDLGMYYSNGNGPSQSYLCFHRAAANASALLFERVSKK